jgi:hypothetical protein
MTIEELIMRNSLKTTAAAVIFVALTGLTGCATTRDLDTLKLLVEKAQATADAAASAAASAQATADEALACCHANTEKMDRMFKQSMNK